MLDFEFVKELQRLCKKNPICKDCKIRKTFCVYDRDIICELVLLTDEKLKKLIEVLERDI